VEALGVMAADGGSQDLESFEPADIKVMSDAYNKAMDDICGFAHPKKIVREIIATWIIKITNGDKRDPHRLRERALD
jgi:hypothetical protein